MAEFKSTKDLLQGEVQDLREEIALVSPKDTPLTTLLMSMGKVVPAKDITVSWRERELNGTRGNVLVEGAECGTPLKSTRKMFTNYCQILEKVYSVTGTLSALNPVGIGDEKAREIEDRLAELKMDMEYYFLQGAKAEESGMTGRQMNGLLNMVKNSIDVSSASLTEDHIIDGMQKMWEKGAHGDVYLLCNATIKRKINKLFSSSDSTRVQASTHNSLGIMVDTVETDFGTCHIVLDRHMPENQILGIDLENVEIAELRPAFHEELAKTGDYTKGHIVVENTIKLLNQYAGFKIINIGA